MLSKPNSLWRGLTKSFVVAKKNWSPTSIKRATYHSPFETVCAHGCGIWTACNSQAFTLWTHELCRTISISADMCWGFHMLLYWAEILSILILLILTLQLCSTVTEPIVSSLFDDEPNCREAQYLQVYLLNILTIFKQSGPGSLSEVDRRFFRFLIFQATVILPAFLKHSLRCGSFL